MSAKFSGLGLSVDQPARMEILHPVTRQPLRNSSDGTVAWIDILSSGSKVGRAQDRVVTDAQIRMRNARLTAEQIEANITEKIAKLTKDWSLVSLEGDVLDVPFSEANARELYSLPELAWLRDQVLAFADDLGNYRPAVSKNSLLTPSESSL